MCAIALWVQISDHREKILKCILLFYTLIVLKDFYYVSVTLNFHLIWSLSQAAFILNILKRILKSKKEASELISVSLLFKSQAIFGMNTIYWISCHSLPTFHYLLKFPGPTSMTPWVIQRVKNENLWGQWCTVLQKKSVTKLEMLHFYW